MDSLLLSPAESPQNYNYSSNHVEMCNRSRMINPEKPLIYYLSFTQLSSYLTIISLSIHICNVSSTHIYQSFVYRLSYVSSFIYHLIYLPHLYIYLGGSHSKESACNVGDLGSIPGLVSSPGEGNRYPLRSSCLENPVNTGAWWAILHGVAELDAT